MISLPGVTFVIVENRWPERVKNFCDYIQHNVADAKISVKSDLPTVGDKSHYDRFCSIELHTVFDTPHALVCQLDGYPIHWSSWEDDFLNYDYIGAPWPQQWVPEGCRVGNGGLSLRSRRLCLALSEQPWIPMPDDVFICQHSAEQMRQKGMRYAPPDVAARFSIEHPVPESVAQPFGFHDIRFHPYPAL